MLNEVIGWLGMILIFLAYLLVTLRKISSGSKEYQLLNLFGAIGIAVNSFVHHALPSVILNFFWFVVAIIGLRKIKMK
jgi:cell division protein FtsW (lipid II flippase)